MSGHASARSHVAGRSEAIGQTGVLWRGEAQCEGGQEDTTRRSHRVRRRGDHAKTAANSVERDVNEAGLDHPLPNDDGRARRSPAGPSQDAETQPERSEVSSRARRRLRGEESPVRRWSPRAASDVDAASARACAAGPGRALPGQFVVVRASMDTSGTVNDRAALPVRYSTAEDRRTPVRGAAGGVDHEARFVKRAVEAGDGERGPWRRAGHDSRGSGPGERACWMW